jgi:hypothetical protein
MNISWSRDVDDVFGTHKTGPSTSGSGLNVKLCSRFVQSASSRVFSLLCS